MNYHQSNVFHQDLSNSLHHWFNLSNFNSGEPQQFLVVFPVVILRFLKTEEEFLFNLAPFSSRFMILACCHPLIIVFDCQNSFHPSGAIQESFRFDSPKAFISGLFIPAFSCCSPNLTSASFNIL